MPQLQVSRHIAAPPETVFDRLTDMSKWVDTIDAITNVEVLTDGPMSVGTRWRETRIMFGREATEEMEITTFEKPSRYVAEAASHGSRYWTQFACSPDNDGTRVEMTFRATPQTVLAKVLSAVTGPLMMKSVVKAVESDLDDIKVAIEAHGISES